MFDDKTIAAHRLASDLNVADLDNAQWGKAQPAQIDRYWSGDPAPASRHAEARILWSNKALYLRFVCHQSEPLIVSDKPQHEKKTMGLWDRDVGKNPDRGYLAWQATKTPKPNFHVPQVFGWLVFV